MSTRKQRPIQFRLSIEEAEALRFAALLAAREAKLIYDIELIKIADRLEKRLDSAHRPVAKPSKTADAGALYTGMALPALAKVIAAKRVVCSQLPTATLSRDPLAVDLKTVALEQRRAMLEAMTLEQRRVTLDKHYAQRKTWTEVKGERPQPEKFAAWLNDTFPDRHDIGMVLSDLKHLDYSAYRKVENWSRKDSGVSQATIESFGLPTKITRYDPERDAKAPATLSEVVARAERGEDTIKNLHRCYQRARHHLKRG